MERRSRSTTRGGGGDLGPRHSSARFYSEGGAGLVVPPPSLAHRPGGDARTLSPDRRNGRNYASKSSSYNHYTMNPPPPVFHGHAPAPPPAPYPRAPHVLPPPTGPPPPRPPPPPSVPSPAARTTSTPQSTPVRYEDFAEGLNGGGGRQLQSPPKSTSIKTAPVSEKEIPLGEV